jgi:hypothetical protein
MLTHRIISIREKYAYCSIIFFILEPMVELYTSIPNQVLCRFTELTSRFHGLAQITAALSWQASPSSPRYCINC